MLTTQPLHLNSSLTQDVPLLLNESNLAFELSRIIVLNLLPLLISTVLYARIFQVVIQTSRTMEETTGQRTRGPTKLITQSVIILLCVTCSVWVVYIFTKAASLFVSLHEHFFIYWKLFCVIAHPFGEGLLHPSARKPVRRVREWVHERSRRRVGPSPSPTMMYEQDSFMYSDTGRSLAEQLPTLLEERDSMIPRQPSKSEVTSDLPNSEKPVPMRRPSIRYARPSMLVRNAAYIGLECRDTSSVVNIYRGRKESVEKLKRELRNVDELTSERSTARRLSTCLRLSSIDDFSEDEIYERYREMYSRRGSSKYSDKSSSRKRSDASAVTPEYKGLSYAKNSCFRERKGSEGSPSRKRWKKLYTTARSARRFSKLQNHCSARIEEEVGKQSIQSVVTPEIPESSPRNDHDLKTKTAKEEEKGVRISVTSLAHQRLCSLFGAHRRSLDSYLRSQDEDKPKPPNPVTKKRSISCVNNAWQKAREEHAKRGSQRKTSVSVISRANADGQPKVYDNNTLRSLSYDAKEYYNYQKQREEREQATRRSYGNNRYSRHSQEKIKVAHWLLEKDTTKEECIEKLIEMKDYF